MSALQTAQGWAGRGATSKLLQAVTDRSQVLPGFGSEPYPVPCHGSLSTRQLARWQSVSIHISITDTRVFSDLILEVAINCAVTWLKQSLPSLHPSSQQPKGRSNPNVHQRVNEWTNCGTDIRWSIIQTSLKRRKILTHVIACMNLEDVLLSEWSQTQNDKYCTIPLTALSQSQIHRNWKLNGGHRGLEWRTGSCSMGDRASVLQDEKVLEMGCTTTWIYLTPLNYTFKNG